MSKIPKPFNLPYLAITGDTTLVANKYNVILGDLTGNTTLSLPDLATVIQGFYMQIVNYSAFTLTIAAFPGNTVGGSPTLTCPNMVTLLGDQATNMWAVMQDNSTGIFIDTEFAILDAADHTKKLLVDVQGSPNTSTTIKTSQTANRSYTIPDFDGTSLVSQDSTGIVFINQAGVLHGSNSGIQYATTFSSRAQFRGNQYGNNTGVPGISTFKSRGTNIGDLAPVQVGDVIYRDTAVGVTDNLSIPLSGMISIDVVSVPPGQGYIGTSFQVQLVPKDGPANGRKEMFRIASKGIFQVREAANSMAGVATLGAGGTIVVANTEVSATTKFTLTVQDGGPAPTGIPYISARVVGTSFTITSSTGAGDVGVKVYYQLWEPTAP